MVGKLGLRTRDAGRVSMITPAVFMLGGSDALHSKPMHIRHRVKATRVPKFSHTLQINEKYGFVQFCIFCVGGFLILSRAVGEIGSSGARLPMQNDLAHLTESARLPMDGCAGS